MSGTSKIKPNQTKPDRANSSKIQSSATNHTNRSRSFLVIAVVLLTVTFITVSLILLLIQMGIPATAALPTVAVLPSDTPTTAATPIPSSTDSTTPSATDTNTATLSSTSTELGVSTNATSTSTATSPVSTVIAVSSLTESFPPPTATLAPSSAPTTVVPGTVIIRIAEKSGTQARSGPGISYEVVHLVDFGSTYTVQAYAKDFLGYTWYLTTLSDNTPAWILAPAAEVILGETAVTQIAAAATIPATPTLTPTVTLTPGSSDEAQLQAIPVFYNVGTDLQAIYTKGQQAGNHSNVFAKVGDCNSVSDSYMKPFDMGLYKLGYYAYLQKTIRTFKGAFGRDSIAAKVGFNVATVQDSMWSDPKVCQANESPLACEYRIIQPSVAIIMFGANDVTFLPAQNYRSHMEQIIQKSLEQGIIPVLMTFTWHDHGALYSKVIDFNMILVDLADKYHIPLINFWLASQYLPDHGIDKDNAHLTWSVNGLNFTGEQTQWGETLRSLLVLEVLDQIQTQVNTSSS